MLYPFLKSYFTADRRIKEHGGPKSKGATLPNAHKVFQMLTEINTKAPWLHKGLLDRFECVMIMDQNVGTSRFSDDLEGMEPAWHELHHSYSVIACMFNLMRAFPWRFTSWEADPETPEEFIWGFSHEDWYRAYTIILTSRRRRTDKTAFPPRQARPTNKPVFEGYTNQLGITTAAVKPDDKLQAANVRTLEYEAAVLGGEDPSVDNPEEPASQELIEEMMGRKVAAMYRKHRGIAKPGVVDPASGISSAITNGIAEVMMAHNPSPDMGELDTADPDDPMQRRITPEEQTLVMEMAEKYANIKYDGLIDDNKVAMPADATARMIAEAEDDSVAFETNEGMLRPGDRLCSSHELLGDCLPTGEEGDLVKVCKDNGFQDWRDLRICSHNEKLCLTPAQLIGKSHTHTYTNTHAHSFPPHYIT